MFDTASKDVKRGGAARPKAPHQRVHGTAAVSFNVDGRLDRLSQSGSAKAMLPRMHGRAPEVVFLNTAGGLTGGDRLHYSVELGGGSAVVTTQTAERAYKSLGDVAQMRTRLSLGPAAMLHWLPQELIVFDGAGLDRTLEVDMADDATLVMLETLVLGRAAMGEMVRRLHLRDRRVVRRAGRPVLVEAVRLDDRDLSRPGPAGLDGARAVASLTYLARDAEHRIGAIREKIARAPDISPETVRVAASAWEGRLTLRFAARDAHPLRRAVARVVADLTQRALPRVWQH